MSEDAERKRLAREASRLLMDVKTNLRTLSEDAHISYGSLKIALSPKNAARSSVLPTYLEAIADALEKRSGQMKETARELRSLARKAQVS